MSVFRPAARLTGPDGRRWEIYAYKLKGPPRGVPPSRRRRTAGRWIRRLVEVSAAAARALRSDEWTIEAVTWLPAAERYAWTTTTEYKGQVLAQVEGQLARGAVPQRLTNATYLGARR